MCTGLHLKFSLLLSDFNAFELPRNFFEEKHSNIKFHKNPSSGSPVVPFGRTDRHNEVHSRLFAIF